MWFSEFPVTFSTFSLRVNLLAQLFGAISLCPSYTRKHFFLYIFRALTIATVAGYNASVVLLYSFEEVTRQKCFCAFKNDQCGCIWLCRCFLRVIYRSLSISLIELIFASTPPVFALETLRCSSCCRLLSCILYGIIIKLSNLFRRLIAADIDFRVHIWCATLPNSRSCHQKVRRLFPSNHRQKTLRDLRPYKRSGWRQRFRRGNRRVWHGARSPWGVLPAGYSTQE